MRVLAVVLSLTLAALPAYASFEDLPVGPRAQALGSAYAAQGDDISGMFANPAALASLGRNQAFLTYEKDPSLTDGTNLGRQIIAFGSPFRFGTLALGIDSFSAGSLYSERAMVLGYGRPVGSRGTLGFGMRNLSVKYGSDQFSGLNSLQGKSKTAMGIDLGYRHYARKATYAISIINANEPDLGIKSSSKVDRKISLGMAVPTPVLDFMTQLDRVGKDTHINLGLERWNKGRHLALRGGVNFGSRDYRNLGLGFGYVTRIVTFDYALLLPFSGIATTLGTHQIGLTFQWGKGGKSRGRARPDEEGEETGDVVSARPHRASDEERERARRALADARADILKGRYKQGLESIQQSDLELMSDEEMAELGRLMKQTATVASIYPRLEGGDAKTKLVRAAVGAYMSGSGKTAVHAAIFAEQKWPSDPAVKRLKDLIVKEFPSDAFDVRPLPAVTLVQQFLQEALELIYGGKYVAAISKCNDVLELDFENTMALTRIGSAYWAMGLEEPARSSWRKALDLDPNNEQLLSFLKRKAPAAIRRTGKQGPTPEQEEDFRNGVAYYERLRRAGADKPTLEKILKKMIDQYEGTGVDLGYVYKEYERLAKR